jgi:hypothetical protein
VVDLRKATRSLAINLRSTELDTFFNSIFGGQFGAENGGHFAAKSGGHYPAKIGGHFTRNLHFDTLP